MLTRIKDDALGHLGGSSPKLLHPYFDGYGQALRFHGKSEIQGGHGLWDFNRWFISHAYCGSQGWASYCVLLTNTDEKAFELFFEFRNLFIKSGWKEKEPTPSGDRTGEISILGLIKSDAFRTRPAMYLANDLWLPSLWAMWNGYVWAEKDIVFEGSPDTEAFIGFQEWLNGRFEFARGASWGKVFDFLALGVRDKAFENFFDHLYLYLDGAPPDARTPRYQAFLDGAVAAALKEQEKHAR